jgi:hypothetical protein
MKIGLNKYYSTFPFLMVILYKLFRSYRSLEPVDTDFERKSAKAIEPPAILEEQDRDSQKLGNVDTKILS